MRSRNRRWILAWATASFFILQILRCETAEVDNKNLTIPDSEGTATNKDNRVLFSPRMDYEQWTPLGRGDPLKNDPTYVYVPPVLERVHYWVDPANRKPDPPIPSESQKTEILVLGVSSKKSSTGTNIADNRKDYDPFLKFVEAPKFNHYQRISRPYSGYFPQAYYPNKKISSERGSFVKDQRVPYTMLVPPPIPKRPSTQEAITQKPLLLSSVNTQGTGSTKYTSQIPSQTTPSVSIQEANLVYQSSSLSDESEWNQDNHFIAIGESSSHVTWRTPTPKPTLEKSVERPNSIVSINKDKLQPPESYVQFQQIFSGPRNHTLKTEEDVSQSFKPTLFVLQNDGKINGLDVMIKGQVSDDNMDIESSYVNIGKPEAQVDSSSGLSISGIPIQPPQMLVRPVIHTMDLSTGTLAPPTSPNLPPITLQTLQSMQTMQPPPVSLPIELKPHIASSPLIGLLKSEVTTSAISAQTTPTPTTTQEQEITNFVTPTTPPSTPPTSPTTSLTTDPLFKHYKQPAEPLKGPMYLIIQGHSKVKTYGPSKTIHGIQIQETNEIPTSDDKDLEFSVKHLHGFKKNEKPHERNSPRAGRSGNLQTLTHVVKTGLGAIDLSEIPNNRRVDENVQETELEATFAANSQTSSEKYYKGIVETARKLKDATL